jgi:hypothetical protein
MIPRTLLSFALLLAPVAAQRVVVIDAANGPGTNHTTLAGAFAGLLAGDILVLRAGTYDAVQISTPLSFCMQGEGSPTVRPSPTTNQAMSLTMWAGAPQRISIKGIRFESNRTGQWALTVATNQNSWPAPTVHLEDCVVDSVSPKADRVALLAQSIGLTVQRCTLDTTQIIGSLATIVDSTITGHDLSTWMGFTQRAQTALDVIRSKVWIVDSTLTAGSSFGAYAEPATCVGFSDSSFTTSSLVHVCGNSVLVADPAPSSQWPAPYVFRNYSWFYPLSPSVHYEPSVVMTPSPIGPVWSGSITQVTRALPSQSASTAPIGGVFTATTHGQPGDLAVAFASLTSFAQRIGTWELLIDVTAMAGLGAFVAGPSGDVPFAIPIPNLASMRGLCIEVGAATLTPAGLIELTNPVAGLVQ